MPQGPYSVKSLRKALQTTLEYPETIQSGYGSSTAESSRDCGRSPVSVAPQEVSENLTMPLLVDTLTVMGNFAYS